MSVLPFSDFLDLLRAKGLGVSLHEHIAVGRLLERWDATDRDRFRDAIAALVARNEDETRVIRDLFDQFYPREAPPSERTPAPGAVARRRYRGIQLLRSRTAWAVTLTLVACAFATGLVLRVLRNTEPAAVAPEPCPVCRSRVARSTSTGCSNAGSGTRDRVRRADAVLPCG